MVTRMAGTTTEPMEIYAKVIQHLALFARDFSSRLYHSMGTSAVELELDDEVETTVPHPFVCRRGLVRTVKPPLDINAMIIQVTQCGAHAYPDGRGVCPMHPVVDDALLAIYALGGDDAVNGKHPVGYDRDVYQSWLLMLECFRQTVTKHDDLIADADDRILNGAMDFVPIPKQLQPDTRLGKLERFVVSVRPRDPVRRKVRLRKKQWL